MMAATIVGCSGCAAMAQPLELLPLLPEWNTAFTLSAGGGYKDNVTLSHFKPEASPFVTAEAEAIVSRLYLDGSQLNFFLSGEERYYLSASEVDNEELVFAQAQAKKVWAGRGEASLGLEYFFQNQVVDVSTTETIRRAIPAVGHLLTARPGFRRELPPAYWFSLELPVSRQLYQEPLDNDWQFGARFALGHDFPNKSGLQLSYQCSYVAFDNAVKVAADGAPLPGTHRAFLQPDLRLTWRQHWDAGQHWRTTAKAGCRFNDDNGSGYFNFTRPYGSAELRYRTSAWEISASGEVSSYDYPVQAVSVLDPSQRERQEVLAALRCERQLCRSLRLVAAYEYEQVFSNDAIETYAVNTVRGSLQWEF